MLEIGRQYRDVLVVTSDSRGSGKLTQFGETLPEQMIELEIDVFAAMQSDSGQPLTLLMADGGAARNNFLMQFQADILGIPVVRSRASDLSAMGVAYLAGLTTGVWKSLDEVSALSRPHDRFEPLMPNRYRDLLLEGWRDAVHRSLSAK